MALLPCQCVKCALLHSVTHHHHITDILIYTINYNTHIAYYAISYNTYCISHISHTCTHCYILCYTVHTYILIYSYILWYITTWSVITPSRHTHHICIYVTFCHALHYIHQTYNRIQKQDRQQTDIRQKDIKKKRYISTASGLFTKYIIDCFLCSTACRYDKLVITLENFQPTLYICCRVLKGLRCFNSQHIHNGCATDFCYKFLFAIGFTSKWCNCSAFQSIKPTFMSCAVC